MFATDIWRVGVVNAPIDRIIAAQDLTGFEICWLEERGSLRFIADPFGLWRGDHLYIFAETYDYRTRRGRIKVIVLDRALSVISERIVLDEPWHLSYSFVFEDDGDIWMLAEAYKSGRLSLYRAVEFPGRWVREGRFSFPTAAIDASPVKTEGGWWMFYTPPSPKSWRTSALALAHSKTLFGPWQQIGDGPVLIDPSGARMGGTPVWQGDTLLLPTQDCRQTYGAGIAIRKIRGLGVSGIQIEDGPRITPPADFAPYNKGLHTLSAAGPVTLIDVKRMTCSLRKPVYALSRRFCPCRPGGL